MNSIAPVKKIRGLIPAYNLLNNVKQVDLYRLLVESIQDYAIFLIDTTGQVASWNAGAQKLKGYKANEIIGKHIAIFYPTSDVEKGKPEQNLFAARQYGCVEDEGWRLRKDGSRFWANTVVTALYDNSGQLQGYAKITRDLTERKRNEDRLKRMNAALKRQQKELQKLYQAKDEFISLASHQLRTPATIVKQYLGIILEGYAGKVAQNQRVYLQKAQLSNERQIETVNDLLKLAKIDSDKVKLNKKPANIEELVKDIISSQDNFFKDRNQKISLELVNNSVVASVDVERLHMAIENLINNASKYTPTGGQIRIAVKTASGFVQVLIADSGVGIKEEDFCRLFKQFSRIPNELSEQAGGSGLGLYWAEKVIRLHGGHIDVNSKIGQGTLFKINIPLGRVSG